MGAVQDSYITVAWLVLLVALLVIEIITWDFTTIWGAGRCAGGTDPEYFGYTVCRTGSCIFCCDNFTACIYQTICNAFYQYPPSKDEL